MNWLFDRLAERSTWLGVVGLLSAVGVAVSPEAKEAIATAGVAVAAAIAILTKDTPPA
ncbi:hypothetical protein [Elstera litoralis]|uniref:hypothetical protein n=1 Tax=Elstera litoralis TaxID=552518 RepID=UPI0018DBF0E9|nr:hypothetical protein [Elstera litoralis]